MAELFDYKMIQNLAIERTKVVARLEAALPKIKSALRDLDEAAEFLTLELPLRCAQLDAEADRIVGDEVIKGMRWLAETAKLLKAKLSDTDPYSKHGSLAALSGLRDLLARVPYVD